MGRLKAGTGKVDITPCVGIELCGYGVYLKRKARTIHDNLYARAVVLDDGSTRAALVTTDLIGVTKETVDRARSLISYKTGIRKDSIIICASHTHSGPATAGLRRGWGESNTEYLDTLPIGIANAAIAAAESLKEARIGFGRGKIDSISFNREENPDRSEIDEEKGTIDPEVGVVSIENTEGEPLAILFNFACHAVTLDFRTGEGKTVSADYPGYAERMLEQHNKSAVAMFLQGACGDIDPRYVWRSYTEMAKTGKILADEVSRVRKETKTTSEIEMRIRHQVIGLPYDLPSLEEMGKLMVEKLKQLSQYSHKENSEEAQWAKFYAGWANQMLVKLENKPEDEMKTEIQALRINDTILVTVPGELFVEFGLKIKKEIPHRNVLVVGYANDYIGYIPTEKDFENNGYGAKEVPQIIGNFPFAKNVGSILTEQILKLVHSL